MTPQKDFSIKELRLPAYSFEPAQMDILDANSLSTFYQHFGVEPFCEVVILQEFKDLIFVDSVYTSNIIKPLAIRKRDGTILSSSESDALLYSYLDTNAPLEILLDYPLSSELKLTIFPLIASYQYPSTQIKSYPIGYLCWQIITAYASLYKTPPEGVEAEDHDLAELRLTELIVYPNNKIQLDICS